jgi:hypothetical protein
VRQSANHLNKTKKENQNKTHIVMQPEIHHLLMIADMVGPKE